MNTHRDHPSRMLQTHMIHIRNNKRKIVEPIANAQLVIDIVSYPGQIFVQPFLHEVSHPINRNITPQARILR